MSTKESEIWDPTFYTRSLLFEPLEIVHNSSFMDFSHWPKIEDYNQFLASFSPPPLTKSAKTLLSVEQGKEQNDIHLSYEERIYLTGELQTRIANWHDYFNLLCWVLFPQSKSVLNALQYHDYRFQQQKGLKKRTRRQNALTHFDECGVIVLSASLELIELLRKHEWKQLFWQHRENLAKKMRFIIFGHGLYEKALQPYIGLTGKAIILHVDEALLNKSLLELIHAVDALLLEQLSQGHDDNESLTLHPLPILGVPNWLDSNRSSNFYNNQSYFRPLPN